MTKALITGITGQDGSYLAEFLLNRGYKVHGIIRRSSLFNTGRIDHIFPRLKLHYGDMTDGTNLANILAEVKPDEIYNLAAQSHVQVSFETPEYTANADGLGMLRLLEAVRLLDLKSRIYNASTSEMFGSSPAPQNEKTAFMPCSPYGSAKLYAYWIARNYRDSYGMFISNGILFNHESPRRGETFVTQKVCKAVAMIKAGRQQSVSLGNLTSKRDWGHARDYVDAMWRMLQAKCPGDYVIATNEAHTVKEMVDLAFRIAGMPLIWYGKVAEDENGMVRVRHDNAYERPNEVVHLQGDYSLATEKLGWKPSTSFHGLIKEMVEAQMEKVK